MSPADVVNVFAMALSPIIAVLVTLWVTNRQNKRSDKIFIFRILLVCQNDPIDQRRVEALNLVPIVFKSNGNIVAQYFLYKGLHKELSTLIGIPNQNAFVAKEVALRDAYTKLLELMSKALGYSDKLDWKELKNSFIPNLYYEADGTQHWY